MTKPIVFSLFLTILVTFVFGCTPSENTAAKLEKNLEEANQKIAQLTTELASAKSDVAKAKKTIDQLQSTPEQRYGVLVDKSENLNSVDQAAKLLSEIDEFIKKNPGSTLLVSARKLQRTINKGHKKLKVEAETLAAEKAIKDLRSLLSGIQDGNTLDGETNKKIILRVTQSCSLGALKKLPSTSYKEVRKDPDSERGKVLRFRGKIIEISKIEEGLYEGLLFSNYDVVKFIALGSTKGLFEKSWGTFYGVFTQLFSYPNAGGGTTHSLVLVGYFDIKENR